MKKWFRMLALLLALATLMCAAAPALALAEDSKPAIIPTTLWANCEYSFGVSFRDMPDGALLVSVKSSKPSVIRATKLGNDIYDTDLLPLNPGKSRITVKYKYKGKIRTLSAVYTVKKYPNPLKSVIVDGTAVDIKNNPYYYDCEDYTGAKPRVKLKMAKGWKVDWTWGCLQKVDSDGILKEFTPKNGKAFKLPKDCNGFVFFTLVNSKGEDIQYGVRFFR